MVYYKWKAVADPNNFNLKLAVTNPNDPSVKYSTGAIQSSNSETAIFELLSKGIKPLELVAVGYEEYRRLHAANVHIDKLQKLQVALLGNRKIQTPPKPQRNINVRLVLLVLAIFSIGILVGLLIRHY